MKRLIYVTVLLFAFIVSFTEKEQETFTFVQLCDTQLGHGGYEHDIKSFEMAVEQINKLNPDFVVLCGDLVNKRKDSVFSDFKEIMNRFEVPCYIAPGNHDVGVIPNKTSLNYYRKVIGKDYFTFQNKGYSFIVTNTQLWKADVENESEKHDNWFKKTLKNKSVNENPVFVIGHYPLFMKNLEEEETNRNLPITKRKEILKLFTQNNVIAYLTGHTHKTIINNYENIQLVSGGATSKNIGNESLGFRVWNVASDTVTHHFTPLQPTFLE